MHRKISISELDATTRYDLHTRLEGMPKHNKVCHGDFNPSNIIITEDGTPYILDWSHATQGNASADAARTYLLFCLNGDTEGAKNYLKLFCQRAIPQNNMFRNGCRLLQPHSRLRATKKSANSCFLG